jgi:hypothetical protein
MVLNIDDGRVFSINDGRIDNGRIDDGRILRYLLFYCTIDCH